MRQDGDSPSNSESFSDLPAEPVTSEATKRQAKALRRVERNRTLPTWIKRLPRIIFPVYGIMRSHDKNYEEHYEHWEEQVRREYDARDERES
jgi:hypothetical protein